MFIKGNVKSEVGLPLNMSLVDIKVWLEHCYCLASNSWNTIVSSIWSIILSLFKDDMLFWISFYVSLIYNYANAGLSPTGGNKEPIRW